MKVILLRLFSNSYGVMFLMSIILSHFQCHSFRSTPHFLWCSPIHMFLCHVKAKYLLLCSFDTEDTRFHACLETLERACVQVFNSTFEVSSFQNNFVLILIIWAKRCAQIIPVFNLKSVHVIFHEIIIS